MLSFGERLKKARERSGLTQSEVMKLSSVSDKSLSRYENNSTSPDPKIIRELICLYDVSPDYIMGFSSVMGHCPADPSGTSMAVPVVVSDIHEKLDDLSPEARKKAEEYIEMLKTLDEVKNGDNFVDFAKNA